MSKLKVLGIIAECNPFHEGHAYLLKEAKRRSGADFTVVVLSGDFVQRGAPAIYDKYLRTREILSHGADLVLELPLYYSVSSADYFARGGVALLSGLGVITDLAFGSESGDLSSLLTAAQSLLLLEQEETPAFQGKLQEALCEGKTFAAARASAIPELPKSPNDLLAVHYLAALLREGYDQIRVHAIPRIQTASATECRERLLKARGSSVEAPSLLPSSASGKNESMSAKANAIPLRADDFSQALLVRLLEASKHLTDYADVSPALADKIRAHIGEYRSFEQFAALLKSKDLTYTRVCRALLHILLSVRADHLSDYLEAGTVGYARILGLKKNAASLLHEIDMCNTIEPGLTILSRLAKDEAKLSSPWNRMLEEELRASDFYTLTAASMSPADQTKPVSEYRRHMITM